MTFPIQSILCHSRGSVLYLLSDGTKESVLKASRHFSREDQEAFSDEFQVMQHLRHPVLPIYYDYYDKIQIADGQEAVSAIHMEYIKGIPFSSLSYLTTKQFKKYILDLGDALLLLLQHGVLYLDLHPGNLILQGEQIRLIDLTRAYYFLVNPHPSYTPKISYELNQHLAGQQLLIQALTLFLLHLPEQFPKNGIPASLFELGLHPHSGIRFSEFLTRLDQEWIL